MGYFTWTLANRKVREVSRGCFADYAASCKLRYGGLGCVICPDDSVIVEPCYDGYGKFDGHDIFELVVDWNKGRLVRILNTQKDPRPEYYIQLAKALDIGSEEDCLKLVTELVEADKAPKVFMIGWKRFLGIEISSGRKNEALPFPVKITDTPRPRKKYKDLPASISCQ